MKYNTRAMLLTVTTLSCTLFLRGVTPYLGSWSHSIDRLPAAGPDSNLCSRLFNGEKEPGNNADQPGKYRSRFRPTFTASLPTTGSSKTPLVILLTEGAPKIVELLRSRLTGDVSFSHSEYNQRQLRIKELTHEGREQSWLDLGIISESHPAQFQLLEQLLKGCIHTKNYFSEQSGVSEFALAVRKVNKSSSTSGIRAKNKSAQVYVKPGDIDFYVVFKNGTRITFDTLLKLSKTFVRSNNKYDDQVGFTDLLARSPFIDAQEFSLPPPKDVSQLESGPSIFIADRVGMALLEPSKIKTDDTGTFVTDGDYRFYFPKMFDKSGDPILEKSLADYQALQQVAVRNNFDLRIIFSEGESNRDFTQPAYVSATLTGIGAVLDINGHRVGLKDFLYYTAETRGGDPNHALNDLASGRLEGQFEKNRGLPEKSSADQPAQPKQLPPPPAQPKLSFAPNAVVAEPVAAPVTIKAAPKAAPAPIVETPGNAEGLPFTEGSPFDVAARPEAPKAGPLAKPLPVSASVSRQGPVAVNFGDARQRVEALLVQAGDHEGAKALLATSDGIASLNQSFDAVVSSIGKSTSLQVSLSALQTKVTNADGTQVEAGKLIGELAAQVAKLAPAPVTLLGRMARASKDVPILGKLLSRFGDARARARSVESTIGDIAKKMEATETRLAKEDADLRSSAEQLVRYDEQLVSADELAAQMESTVKALELTLSSKEPKDRQPRDHINLTEVQTLLGEITTYRRTFAERRAAIMAAIVQMGMSHEYVRTLISTLRAEVGTATLLLSTGAQTLGTLGNVANGQAQIAALRNAVGSVVTGAANELDRQSDLPLQLARSAGNITAITQAIETTAKAKLKFDQSRAKAIVVNAQTIATLNSIRPVVVIEDVATEVKALPESSEGDAKGKDIN